MKRFGQNVDLWKKSESVCAGKSKQHRDVLVDCTDSIIKVCRAVAFAVGDFKMVYCRKKDLFLPLLIKAENEQLLLYSSPPVLDMGFPLYFG